jgi:hypothetical protein
MPQDNSHDHEFGGPARATLRRAAFGGAVVALLICANNPPALAGDGDFDSISGLYSRFVNSLGLGSSKSDVGIDYNERSPLVVPPTRDLPKPEAATAPKNPAWPKDPDVRRRQQAKVEDKITPGLDRVLENGRPLRPDELNAARQKTTSATSVTTASTPDTPDPPKKSLFSLDAFKTDQYTTFPGEPTRESLTDPPVGYRTPSADQPYGTGPERAKQYQIPTLETRVEPQR